MTLMKDSLTQWIAWQGPLLGLVLAGSAAAKLRMGHTGFAQTALAGLLRQKGHAEDMATTRRLWVTTIASETLLALMLWLGVEPREVGALAAAFFAAAATYLALALRYQPDSSCGCFSARVPVHASGIIRALVLSSAAIAYGVVGVDTWSVHLAGAQRVLVTAVLVVEAIILVGLSHEIMIQGRVLLGALRRTVVGGQYGREPFLIALARERVEHTHFWTNYILSAAAGARPQLRDTWVAAGRRHLEYGAEWFGERATIVAALWVDAVVTWRIVVSIEPPGEAGRIVAAFDAESDRTLRRRGWPHRLWVTPRRPSVVSAS